MTDTLTITDNRTGKTYEIRIEDGAIKAMDLRQIKTSVDDFGLMTYDPAYTNTAACRSRITYIDGDKGILLYRGYPIEQLAEQSTYLETAYLILFGELPTQAQLDNWTREITLHTMLHENIKKLMDGFQYDAHPMGIFLSTVGALSTIYSEAKRVNEEDLPFFVGLMEHLAARGINCPLPVKTREGQALGRLAGRPAAIVTFLDGMGVRRPGVGHCGAVGEALARLHVAGADFPMRRVNALSVQGWRPLYETARERADTVTPGLRFDLGSEGIRCNLVSAGPLKTLAAKAIPGFEGLESLWKDRAPLGWDIEDPVPAAKACAALLSDWFPATSGEIVHVDGGYHAVGA